MEQILSGSWDGSAWRIVQSPFYALAYMIAQLCVFVDTNNGRKIIANIERDWNRGVLADNGCALAYCWHKHQTSNDGVTTGMDLGREDFSAFYIQGCFQPTAILKFEDHVCTEVKAPNGYISGNSPWIVRRGWKDV